MTKNADQYKYDGVHFQAETINLRDGSVEGHRAGCADVARQVKKHGEDALLWDCLTKEEVREGYNADFDEETDGWYDIDWKPCANHIPTKAEVEPVAVDLVAVVTTKVGPKWTYIFVDGVQVMEVQTNLAEKMNLIHLVLSSL